MDVKLSYSSSSQSSDESDSPWQLVSDLAMNNCRAAHADSEDVEVIVVEDEDYREVFETTLEDHMERVSLLDHDYSQSSSLQVRQRRGDQSPLFISCLFISRQDVVFDRS